MVNNRQRRCKSWLACWLRLSSFWSPSSSSLYSSCDEIVNAKTTPVTRIATVQTHRYHTHVILFSLQSICCYYYYFKNKDLNYKAVSSEYGRGNLDQMQSFRDEGNYSPIQLTPKVAAKYSNIHLHGGGSVVYSSPIPPTSSSAESFASSNSN